MAKVDKSPDTATTAYMELIRTGKKEFGKRTFSFWESRLSPKKEYESKERFLAEQPSKKEFDFFRQVVGHKLGVLHEEESVKGWEKLKATLGWKIEGKDFLAHVMAEETHFLPRITIFHYTDERSLKEAQELLLRRDLIWSFPRQDEPPYEQYPYKVTHRTWDQFEVFLIEQTGDEEKPAFDLMWHYLYEERLPTLSEWKGQKTGFQMHRMTAHHTDNEMYSRSLEELTKKFAGDYRVTEIYDRRGFPYGFEDITKEATASSNNVSLTRWDLRII
ncbi:MAG TPA: hypothetical protein VJ179_00465 [Patescibacteria group bacterium]|nr:hypothetical protein [Patescibacteria group bacterium]